MLGYLSGQGHQFSLLKTKVSQQKDEVGHLMPRIASVTSVIEALEKLESQHIKVYTQRCVCVRNRHAGCTLCSDACTSGALSLKDNLTINPDLCVGCGTCATVCPTCALETVHPNDAELMHRVKQVIALGSDTVNFICGAAVEAAERPIDRSKVIDVICLSRIEESLVCACMVAGARAINLIRSECKGCSREQGIATVEIVKETVDALVAAWDLRHQIVLTDLIPPDVYLEDDAKNADSLQELSRREFFTALKRNAKLTATLGVASTLGGNGEELEQTGAMAACPVHVMSDGTLPHFVPNRRERLLDQLDILGHPTVETIDTRLWGHIRLDDNRCSSCRMCATFCPTGAICKFDDADGSFGIEHYMADCVHCRLCEDICPKHAISCVTTVPIKELVEGAIERHAMKPLDWQPNKGDSIWRKMQQVIPNANINERC
jgi:formate hydrogenlyase subunit 6/NADH:ubiquinone oxidoreductase subunit I